MTIKITSLAFSAFLAAFISAQTAPASAQETAVASPTTEQLDKIFQDRKWRTSRFGVRIVDFETGKVVYEQDSEKSLMPASNMKVFTTALALSKLGADYRYETPIIASGEIVNGTLKGDIVVVGQGDPSISGRYAERYFGRDDVYTTGILRDWAKAVKDAGIKRIEGSVIGDDDFFDEDEYAGTWQQEYYPEWYAAESSGLAINENCWDVDVIAADQPGKRATLRPRIPSSYFNFASSVLTVPNRGDTSGSLRVSINRKMNTNDITLSGTVTVGYPAEKEWGSIHNGTLHAVTLFQEELVRQGIEVVGNPRDIDYLAHSEKLRLATAPQKVVHVHTSPELAKILAVINKPSQNFYADMLAKTVGAKFGRRGSYSEANRILKAFLEEIGTDPYGIHMADGSGLSRQDYITPKVMTDLLTYMAKRPDFSVFEASLPVMGVDGTVATRLRGTPLQGNVKAKTGTIGRVRSLSGYMTTTGGRKLVFSMIANNFPVATADATAAQNEALKVLLDWKPE